jgi:hypothetical protein
MLPQFQRQVGEDAGEMMAITPRFLLMQRFFLFSVCLSRFQVFNYDSA